MDKFEISVNQFNEFAYEYAERFKNIDSYLDSFDIFIEKIQNENPKLLELACGPGNVTSYLRSKLPSSDYIGIDLAPNMIEIARSQVKDVDFRVMDVRDVLSIKKKFDGILCSFCLPFLSNSDATKLISDCANLLNQNGIIYISIMEGDKSRSGFESTSFSGDSKVYFNYYEQGDIENVLLDNQFKIKEIIRKDYTELDGSITVDMIFIAAKS